MTTDKRELRQRFRQLREGFDEEYAKASSEAVVQNLVNWPLLQTAQTALSYLAFRNEIDLSPLFELMPHISWIVPRVSGPQLILHIHDRQRLVRHRFGMLEPAPDLPQIEPGDLDLVLVPGVAFDRRGGRLGFGGGYYDRLLPLTAAWRVGVTYDQTLVNRLPVHEHDQLVHWIVTPTQRLDCTAGTKSEGEYHNSASPLKPTPPTR
jgi:5-formyltetrahydrofolate cyclo-ligase